MTQIGFESRQPLLGISYTVVGRKCIGVSFIVLRSARFVFTEFSSVVPIFDWVPILRDLKRYKHAFLRTGTHYTFVFAEPSTCVVGSRCTYDSDIHACNDSDTTALSIHRATARRVSLPLRSLQL